ncbi:chemotaxis protein CheR [Marivirga lumbricoides]|uniref:protein-glutamate O-methyltransferase n=1 Tax=Marivirga lumbricoides TaxID=1046115 RepID=A0A2T4DUC9_9BACT|nr:chemotaxis protein CheR [Marivirga lumbricoides]
MQKILNPLSIRLSDSEFQKLGHFIQSYNGIKMPLSKKTMLEVRLQKRLRELNISSFHEYSKLVFSAESSRTEVIKLMDCVSTNKTSFFREIIHFNYLQQHILPDFIRSNNNTLKVWSAGCSSGEEPYSIAIAINEFIRNNGILNYQILGTDISTKILQEAKDAVYTESEISNLSFEVKKRYFLKGKGDYQDLIMVKPAICNKILFQRFNLMDREYSVQGPFDLIFCRNVLIYFDRDVQENVIKKLCQKLKVGGYFFMGHSETIMGMKVPLKQMSPTIYKRI